MTGGRTSHRRLRLPRHAAPATPARTASRSRCRSRCRGGLCAGCCWRRTSVQADRPRRARFAAPRGGPLPLRPRHRRDHQSRSRRASPGRSRSGGAARAAFPAPSASRTSWPTDRKRKRVGIKPDGRAPAREGAEILSPCGERIGVVTSGGFGPTRRTARSRWATSQAAPSPRSARRSILMVRGKALPATIVPLPFVPHRYAAQELNREEVTWPSSASPRTTNGSASTATSAPSASPTTRRASSATWCSSSCRRSAARSSRARPWPWSKASRRRATCSRRCPARWSRPTPTLAGQPALVNEDAEGKAWFFKLKIANPAELDKLMDRAAYEAFVEESH